MLQLSDTNRVFHKLHPTLAYATMFVEKVSYHSLDVSPSNKSSVNKHAQFVIKDCKKNVSVVDRHMSNYDFDPIPFAFFS
jgi:hypothetical protein